QVRGVSEVLSRLLETGLVNGQQALLPEGQGLSPAATGVMEQARTAVVLSAHLIADNVDGDGMVMIPEMLHAAFLEDNHASDLLVQLVHHLLSLMELHATLLGRCHGGGGGGDAGGGGRGGAGGSSPSPLLSPYLGGALLWCLTRVATAYLLPDLTLYEGGRFSYRLTQDFGASTSTVALGNPPQMGGGGGGGAGSDIGGVGGGGDASGAGAALAERLLRASWICLCAWPSQPDVCSNALDLMGALVSRTKAPFTTALPLWWDIVAACSGGREREAAAAAAGRREEGFRRMSADLQVGAMVAVQW
ncbi:unnamed protein product, partial [Laminaria digitata]